MRWSERLKRVAGWDLFLQVLAVGVLVALGAFVLATDRCQGEASAHPETIDSSLQTRPDSGRRGREVAVWVESLGTRSRA